MKYWIMSILLLSQGILIPHSYANINDNDEVTAEAVSQASETHQTAMDEEIACRASENCEVATDVSEAEYYGGIKQEYVVKGCKVTIYNDGPVKMQNEKTGEFCNAPIPEDHKFHKEARTYQKDGCMITEYTAADGVISGTPDCSMKNKQ